MNNITRILSSQQGSYKWRVRDCLTTATSIISGTRSLSLDYSKWHQMEEKDAILLAQKTFGSLYEAHRSVFGEIGLYISENSVIRSPGDICLLEGDLSNLRLGISLNVKNITRLGFVSDNYEIWTWFQSGLFPLHRYSIRGIVKCRQ